MTEIAENKWPSGANAFLIPLATVALYCYSFSFEVGYADYFGYPRGLIPISIGLILNVWTLLFVYLVLFVGFLQLNLSHWPDTPKTRYGFIVVLLGWFGLLIALKAFFPKYLYFGGLLTVIAAFMGLSLMRRAAAKRQRNCEGLLDEKRAPASVSEIPMIYDARSQVDPDSIAYQLVTRLGFDPALVFALVVIVFPALFWSAGLGEARSKQEFYVFSQSGTEYLALRILDSNVIAAPFSESSNTYAKEFLVRPITELAGLKAKRVGNLRSQ